MCVVYGFQLLVKVWIVFIVLALGVLGLLRWKKNQFFFLFVLHLELRGEKKKKRTFSSFKMLIWHLRYSWVRTMIIPINVSTHPPQSLRFSVLRSAFGQLWDPNNHHSLSPVGQDFHEKPVKNFIHSLKRRQRYRVNPIAAYALGNISRYFPCLPLYSCRHLCGQRQIHWRCWSLHQ
jgi:hypothetical protein